MSGSWSNRSLPEPVRQAFDLLKSAMVENHLAHAYIINGPNLEWGVLLAHLMLQQLFCEQGKDGPCGECRGCQSVENRRHPDVTWLEPELKSRVISTDAIRETNHFIRQTSMQGGWKAAVLLSADRINESAANAFLKTLEEPPDKSLLLMVTDQPQKLLATITSRCQQVSIAVTAAERTRSRVETAMLEWLRQRGPETSRFEQTAWIMALLREVKDAAEKIEKARAGDEVEKDVIEARINASVVAARQDVLRTLYQWERDAMALASGGRREELFYPDDHAAILRQGQGRSLASHLRRLDRVDRARRLIEGNLPDQAVWEAVLPV